jgi:hypothetical protein
MESESEPRPCHNQLAVYPLKSTPKVRLQKRQNHTVRDLGSVRADLCGGYQETDIPTATYKSNPPGRKTGLAGLSGD